MKPQIHSSLKLSLNLVSIFTGLFCLLAPALYQPVLAQIQLGADINGEAGGDYSGWFISLSSDGNRLAIGAPNNDGNGVDSGHVRVYQWSSIAWEQIGADIDGESAGDYSGKAISLSADGNRLAIGAPNNGDNITYSSHVTAVQGGSSVRANQNNAGHVRVYQWSGSAWAQLGSDIDGEAAGDRSGDSVSLSSDGNRLAIGAPNNDGNGMTSGHVRVYHWSGTAWAQLGEDINSESVHDASGASVSLSSDGNRLAIGAPWNDGNGLDSGHVRVYQWSSIAWEQIGADIDGESADDNSGVVSLSSDGNRLAIGASGNDDNGKSSGHVRVYQWTDPAWAQLGEDIDGESAGDNSGGSISLSSDGNRLAIGAPVNDGNGDNSGHTRVYQWSDSAWVQIGADIDGEAAGDVSGTSVSLSSDGNRLAIGAPGNLDGKGVDSGYVRAYDLSMFNIFQINPGLNDAWYYEPTSGQGFFITVFPDLGAVSLAWFTYDTELPPLDALANLGDPGHRWLTAVGPIDGNKAVMEIEMTSGGIFDAASIIERTDPPGSDGTIILTFGSCNSGTIEYDIPSIDRQGIIPIVRVANDNIVICEALKAD
jgi:hypothetical protein